MVKALRDLQDRAWAGLEEFINVNNEEETLLICLSWRDYTNIIV